jgi:hypothetical protein
MPKSIKTPITLNEYFSGAAGEARIAAEFIRYGYRVAKPCWNDDEIDLIILDKDNGKMFALPIQIKTVQFLPHGKRPAPERIAIQNLMKKHVNNNIALCLAIYTLDNDRIWFIPGRENIIKAYESQSHWNKKHKTYSKLTLNSQIRIYVSSTPESLHNEWLLPQNDGGAIRKMIVEIKKNINRHWREVVEMELLWR